MIFDIFKFFIISSIYFQYNCIWAKDIDIGLRERLQRNSKLPPAKENKSLNVFAGLYIESLGNFRAAEMNFDMDLYLYLSWRDPSLNHSGMEYVLLNDPKVRHYIWIPDLYFANARTSRFHDVIAPNFNLFIDQNGTIAYSSRITLNVACNLDLSLYPMDSQRCAVQFLSYAYIEKQVKVQWFSVGDATRYNPGIQLPEFHISNISSEYCNGIYNYAIMEHSFKRARFSCLEAIIHLNRQIGYHMVQSYIPTGLIVMISWVSFWIDRRAVPARVTLSFTTLLSLSTLGNGLRFGLPQVAYAKAIDFWFGACMFFVFLSLLEFAAVNSYMRHAEKFERYATLCAKKGSSLYEQKTGNKTGKETPKSTMDTNSLVLASIDASPTEESVEAFKWSSAATIGGVDQNQPTVWLSFALPMGHTSPLRWAQYQHEEDEQRRRIHKAKNSPKKHGKKALIKKCEESSSVIFPNANFDSIGNGRHRFESNPIAAGHFLREGFHYSRKGLKIDQHSRWIFPLGFTIWNILYWGYYLWYIQRYQQK